jgi:hypothetical protein
MNSPLGYNCGQYMKVHKSLELHHRKIKWFSVLCDFAGSCEHGGESFGSMLLGVCLFACSA